MLTFSRLGEKGNLGNQLFQIAATIGLAEKHRHNYCFPKWKYEDKFQFNLPRINGEINFEELKESQFRYHNWSIKDGNYDLNGWLQSEKYFHSGQVRNKLQFKQQFLQRLRGELQEIFSKKTILITVRRGVFVNNLNYYQLDSKYYFLAIIKNFPDWQNRNLVFASDEIDYCKKHYDFLPNSYFLENYSAIEQLAIGSMCDDFIISNSTFSWWIAWLGENKDSLVIRPKKYLRGKFSKTNSDEDYFPERWKIFDEKRYSIPLKYGKLHLISTVYNFKFNLKYYSKLYLKKIRKRVFGRKKFK